MLDSEPSFSNELSRDEFEQLFCALDLELSRGQIDKLLAVIDLSGNNYVSLQEFEDAWELLMREIIEGHLRSLGLSPMQVAMTVIYIIVLLVLLFAFVILVVGAWVGNSDFGAVAQSGLIAVMGQNVTKLSTKSKEEAEEDLNRLVENILGEQEEDANE